jgi:ribosomal protein S15P/S13E
MKDSELEKIIELLLEHLKNNHIESRIVNMRLRKVTDTLMMVEKRDIDIYDDAREALDEYMKIYNTYVFESTDIENLNNKINNIIGRIKINKKDKSSVLVYNITRTVLPPSSLSLYFKTLTIETERIQACIKSIYNIIYNNQDLLSIVASEHLTPIYSFNNSWNDHLSLLSNYIRGKSIFLKKSLISSIEEEDEEDTWENKLDNRLLLKGPSKTPTHTPSPSYSQMYQLVKYPKYTPTPSISYKPSMQIIPKHTVDLTNDISKKLMELFKNLLRRERESSGIMALLILPMEWRFHPKEMPCLLFVLFYLELKRLRYKAMVILGLDRYLPLFHRQYPMD